MEHKIVLKHLGDYDYLVGLFGAEKITQRISVLFDYLNDFIVKENLQNRVAINEALLQHAVVDYFADVARLKEFHDIARINTDKITAYTAYWLLRRRPLQIQGNQDDDEALVFVNERFVLAYMIRYLFGDDFNAILLPKQQIVYDSFLNSLLYFLKYRISDPQSLEMIIIAHAAGKDFQYSKDAANFDVSLLKP